MGALQQFLTEDHERLDELLRQTIAAPTADNPAYVEFRGGLLRHIAMEEKILMPAARRLRGDEPLPIAERLRADHAALASLLVPTPSAEIVALVHDILVEHNEIEECDGGLYDACEQLLGTATAALLTSMQAIGPVPLARHFDGPRVHEHIAELLRARR